MKKFLIPIAILLLILSACGSKPCAEQADEYIKQQAAIIERWDDANEIANSTARMSLAGPLSELQAIKRDADDLEYPECAQALHDAMIEYMDKTIDSYLSFMADDDDDIVGAKIRSADQAFSTYAEEFNAVMFPEEED